MMKYFSRWLIIASLISIGVFALIYSGLIQKIYEADVTKLSFLILVVFLGSTIRVGIYLAQNKNVELRYIYFVTDSFVKIGLIGTICGFIYMLYYTFSGIDLTNISNTQGCLIKMGQGMGTALYTTASGLVCNLLMKAQLFIYEQQRRQYKPF